MYIRLLINLLIIFLITGCSFQPLYNDARNAEFLNQIKVGAIDTGSFPHKLDHILKIELEKEIGIYTSAGNEKYNLDLKINRSKTNFGSKSDSTSTRMLIVFSVYFTLKDIGTSKILFADEVLSYDSFQITESPYSTFVTEEENLNRIVQASVKEIKIRLLSYFIDSKNAAKS